MSAMSAPANPDPPEWQARLAALRAEMAADAAALDAGDAKAGMLKIVDSSLAVAERALANAYRAESAEFKAQEAKKEAHGVNKLLKKYWGVEATDEEVGRLLARMDELNGRDSDDDTPAGDQ